MFSNEQWLANSGADFYNGVATQSLRFDDNSSAYLTRTPSSTGNRKTWTWSGWFKMGNIPSSANYSLFNCNGAVTNTTYFLIRFEATGALYIGNSSTNFCVTSQLFRDPSAWYHIVIVLDSTQATATDRLNVYVNGVQVTAFSSDNRSAQIALNSDQGINQASYHNIGREGTGTSFLLDGYLSEVNFIDGLSFFSDTSGTPNTAFNINSFGEFKNGVWIPIDTSGLTFGTNGFRLKFDQVGVGTASTSTIGADTSGNTNHWTSSGIVASDCNMPDSPENNFATFNPLDNGGVTLSNGNIAITGVGNAFKIARSTIGMSSGKSYVEFIITSEGAPSRLDFGLLGFPATLSGSLGATSNGYTIYESGGQITKYNNNSGSVLVPGGSLDVNDVQMLAYDADSGKLWFGKNGSWFASGNPSSGTNEVFSGVSGETYFLAIQAYNTSDVGHANFGQDSSFAGNKTAQGNTDGNGIGDFYYEPPSGYLALCTKNLPEPTIGANSDTQADDHFDTVLYTGDGSTQNIAVNFQPDFTWIKNRIATDDHQLFDSTRGATEVLESNTTTAEVTNADTLTAFISTGFSLGADVAVNTNAETYVAWNWKAGGTAVSNTDGTITSTVSANTTSGFSIVTFEGNKTRGATIGHGLGVKPDMIIMKNRDLAVSWVVWFPNLQANNQLLELNSTGAVLTNTGDVNAWWNNTAPTSSLITLGDYDGINDDLSMLAYCFHSVEGYSKFGSYTGNSNNDGSFVYLGFRPAWIMIKSSSSAGDSWFISDNKRTTSNVVGVFLRAEGTDAEASAGLLDFVSNGFKLRATSCAVNDATTFIYMAFAEAPFKYANGR